MAAKIALSSRFLLPPFAEGARRAYDQLRGLRPQERMPEALPIRFQARPNPAMPNASRVTQIARITLLRSDFIHLLPPTPRAQTNVPAHNPGAAEEELIEEAPPELESPDDGDSAIGSLSDAEFSETASTGSIIDYADLEYLYFEAQDNLILAQKTVFEFEALLTSSEADKRQLEETLAFLKHDLKELKVYVAHLEGILETQGASHQELEKRLSSRRPVQNQEIATQTDPDIVGLSKKEQKLSTAQAELEHDLSESAERELKLVKALKAAQRENVQLKGQVTELAGHLEDAEALFIEEAERHYAKEHALMQEINASK